MNELQTTNCPREPGRRSFALGDASTPRITATRLVTLVLFVVVAWIISPILLLIFASILLAIVIDGIAFAIAKVTGLRRSSSLAATLLLLCISIFLLVRYSGPVLHEQFGKLIEQIEWAIEILLQEVEQAFGLSSMLDSKVPGTFSNLLSLSGGIFDGAAATVMTFVGVLGGIFLVTAMAVYLAAAPRQYLAGILRLVPRRNRARMLAIARRSVFILRRWLMGQSISMILVGVLSYLGLFLLDVPLAFILAIFAGLTAFVPVVGPFIGGIAMVLVALSENWSLAVWTGGLYLVIQSVESYFLTPLIQRESVELLPAAILANQVIMGALFGLLGMAMATPLTAVAIAAIQRGHSFAERPGSLRP